jgi:hypothetical protein
MRIRACQSLVTCASIYDMAQRFLSATLVVVAGLAASLLAGPAPLLVVLPLAGAVAMSASQALVVLTVVAAFLAGLDLRRGAWPERIEAALAPGLLALGFALSGRVAPEAPVWLLCMALAVVFAATLCAWSATAGGMWTGYGLAGLRQILLYVAALTVFGGIYGMHLRALMTAPLIGVSAAVLALLVMRAAACADNREHSDWQGLAVPSLLAGLVTAQAAWAILFWPVSAEVGGVTLLAVFHLTMGLLRSPEKGRWRWLPVLEYGAVGVAALAVIAIAVLRVR